MKRCNFFGFNFVNDIDYSNLLQEIFDDNHINLGLPLLITPNVDQVVKYQNKQNESLFEFFKQAAYVLPDGQPIVWASKLRRHHKLKSRLTGSDLFPLFWKKIKQTNKKVYLVLSDEPIGKRLQSEHELCHYYIPPFFNLNSDGELQDVVTQITSDVQLLKPDFIFLGIGFPKQEILAQHMYSTLGNEMPLTSLLGASMEFYTGQKKRAPKIYQRLGIEFLHRFLSEPKRLFKRYFIDDIAFIKCIFREFFIKS